MNRRLREHTFNRMKLVIERDDHSLRIRDVYAFILNMTWRRLFAAMLLLYFGINTLFAAIFVAGGDCIRDGRPGSWFDAFSFSVQTLSTIGYGRLSPKTPFAHFVVSLESFVGIVGVALATGIVFTKFARPTAGLVFTDKIVVHQRDSVPSLVFRVANSRGSEIVDATIRVSVLLTETTQEGHRMRRLHDLDLLRTSTPLLLMSWTVIHTIDEQSPLQGLNAQDFVDHDIRFIVNITGIDGTFMQSVYAYNFYLPEDVVFGANFADVVHTDDGRRFHLNMRNFNRLVEEPRTKNAAHGNAANAANHSSKPSSAVDGAEHSGQEPRERRV